MHSWTEKKGVTVSFLTEDVDGWLEHLKSHEGVELRHQEIQDEDRAGVRVFVAYDPEGYFLEFDTFLRTEGNEKLLQLLETHSR
jgi:hypothetical protein